MREAAFIKQNKNNWIKFESLLQNYSEIDAEVLSDLYIKLTDDLSYAQTFYKGSETHKYLNELSVAAHQKIYKNKRESRNKFYQFYFVEFPLMFYQYQKQLLFSFVVFAFFVAVGAFSAANDSDFVRLILGDAYVNQTIANIESGDPMAIYKKSNQVDMFLGITINNIRVSLTAFTLGVLLGLGTLYIVIQNAVMLGSFQFFFYEKGLLWESARTIWIHGTIEISVIILGACAGFVVGQSILMPRTYTRLQSFINGAKDGLKIVISTVPFFIIAGFLEGFVTRLTEMPDWLAILIILSSLGLIIYYYVILPIQVNKAHETKFTIQEK
ncbi:stage II sporulation protein M [Psychroflexus sp. ALD_RP9]|uniref:stage II sporulation protein M n=1 Tax=Psychroflexus sp. ALD_RP9 TaxID=2777186 RepID=UPI001A8E9247|nr:stage II sporulation protein M [Psychroflexus sp. ALD_RP9]QSS96739.1 stage II sporulation protein M [Psychroflexus sp. ALD_RP9]